MMQRQQVSEILSRHAIQLKEFKVKSLMLFGSVARDEANADSDVDLLVEFEKPVGLLTFVGLQQFLEEILNRSVDLGTPDSLKPYLKDNVLREAVSVF